MATCQIPPFKFSCLLQATLGTEPKPLDRASSRNLAVSLVAH